MARGLVKLFSSLSSNYTFNVVNEFVYLRGTSVTAKNDARLKIKHRITCFNRCYRDLNKQSSSRDLSLTMKSVLYKLLTLLAKAEAWSL